MKDETKPKGDTVTKAKDQPTETEKATLQSIVPRLFSATDYTDGSGNYPEECWCIGVWAESEEQALSFAKENYTESDEVESVSVQGVVGAEGFEPESWPREECRCEVLREAGWRSEGEYACEVCDLYAVDLEEFSVCQDCCRCAKCASQESDCGKCENCGL